MAHKERKMRQRATRPTFFVFCEGESEMAYVRLLRQLYHKPIEIKAIKAKSNISDAVIQRELNSSYRSDNDKIFVMFDLDVESVRRNISNIASATKLLSNPCFELWYILHYTDHKAAINSRECLQRLLKVEPKYKKGEINDNLRQRLVSNRGEAIERAKRMEPMQNPSCSVHLLIEALEQF